MSSAESSGTVTPKRRIIANQTAELVTLQQKLNRLEGIGKRYEEQNKLLENALKAKHALQEIFFNTSQEKRELESINKHLEQIIQERDYILKECKEDNALEVESMKRLNGLQVLSLRKQNEALQTKNECYMDVMDTQHEFKCGLSDIKYDTLSTKYKLIKTDNTILKKELKLFKTQFHLMETTNGALHKYEPIVISLLEEIQHYETELNKKQQLLTQFIRNDEAIRSMYDQLKGICAKQDDKIIQITAKNNKLNTIIEQNDIQNEKMQKHFQKDIAHKERTIVKLETKLDALTSRSNTHQDANESLKEEHQVLKEQIAALRNEKGLLKQEIQHMEDKLTNKDDYMEALKRQIQDNNKQITGLQNTQSEREAKHQALNEKYRLNLSKLKKLADKLAQQLEAKKRFKKQYLESKQQLSNVLKENERIERETDKQCDAVQHTMEQYKQKILKKNKQIHGLEDTVNQMETDNREYQQQILLLRKDNEKYKLLIQHLEIDNNEQNKYAQKAREVSQKNRSVFSQIMNENQYSQHECDEILHEIEEQPTEEEENEDDDLAMDSGGRLAGNKRPRSDMMEEDASHNNHNKEVHINNTDCEEPPKKKARRSDKNHTKKKKKIDETPFKGTKAMFRGRKQRNKKQNQELPKPIIH